DLIRMHPEAHMNPAKFGQTIANAAMIVDGGVKGARSVAEAFKLSPEEAVRAAHVATNKVPSRFFRRAAFQKMYVHAEGFANIREIHKAAKLVEDKYGAFAENIAKQIDPHNPLGVVDAKAESKVILAEYKD